MQYFLSKVIYYKTNKTISYDIHLDIGEDKSKKFMQLVYDNRRNLRAYIQLNNNKLILNKYKKVLIITLARFELYKTTK